MKKFTFARPAGVVLYEGASVIDGSPIVCIAAFETSNEKTGNMIQTWIIRSDMPPNVAQKSGADVSVCGSCPQRHSLDGSCYVLVFQAPLNVYKSYKKGNYPLYDPQQHDQFFADRDLRAGAYGDPLAVPYEAWVAPIAASAGGTGYTHQLGHKNFDPRILEFCMVSADTPKQALKYHGMGLRTFRVKTHDAPALPNEIECLADAKGITCMECQLCNSATSAKPNVYINVHGQKAGNYTKKYGKANMIDVLQVA